MEWIAAFLSNRRQIVEINGALSTWVDVTSGILGFLHFVINNLPAVVMGAVKLPANDTHIYEDKTTEEDCKTQQS